MSPIRILIGDPSERLRAAVHSAVANQPDLSTIEDCDSNVEVMLRAEVADVVVVRMSDDHLPAVAEQVLDEYPDIGVIAIDVDRNQGVILQLCPQRTDISELSPPTLCAALRRATSQCVASPRSLQQGDITCHTH